jgi:DNA-directed RNA polymerase subunit RPC12/RpoP
MAFHIEEKCPQCGATLDLTETDRLLICPYCQVKSLLVSPHLFRFFLPGKEDDEDTVYVPYLRFKGSVFTINGLQIEHRIVDLTQRGVDLPFLPLSLGLRPQAMHMQFVSTRLTGHFLANSITVDAMLQRASKLSATGRNANMYQSCIGEAINRIYLPLQVKGNQITDGITTNPFIKDDDPYSTLTPLFDSSPAWQPRFLPAICPECGWDLDGERDSVVLFCRNCNSAWQEKRRCLLRVFFQVGASVSDTAIFLPFWCITAKTSGKIAIANYADFIRITNQPLVPQPDWEQKEMCYRIPAFKIKPKEFLRLGSQLTISLREQGSGATLPRKNVHPVTLPDSEAVQSLHMVLASATISKNEVLPYLADTEFEISNISLQFLPFLPTTHELILQQLSVIINRNALAMGRHL